MQSTSFKRLGGALILGSSMLLASGMAAPQAAPVAAISASGAVGEALEMVDVPVVLPSSRYGLGVVPVPPPPQARTGLAIPACPEVRAVVLGETDELSFVIAGDKVLHRGQALSWGGSQLVVQDLSANQVTFMRGDVVVRCALPKFSMR
jgi:hypothetical protein